MKTKRLLAILAFNVLLGMNANYLIRDIHHYRTLNSHENQILGDPKTEQDCIRRIAYIEIRNAIMAGAAQEVDDEVLQMFEPEANSYFNTLYATFPDKSMKDLIIAFVGNISTYKGYVIAWFIREKIDKSVDLSNPTISNKTRENIWFFYKSYWTICETITKAEIITSSDTSTAIAKKIWISPEDESLLDYPKIIGQILNPAQTRPSSQAN